MNTNKRFAISLLSICLLSISFYLFSGYSIFGQTEIIKNFSLVANEELSAIPEIYFIDASGKRIDPTLEGQEISADPIIFEPTFTCQLFIRAENIADGTGIWYLQPNSLVDLAGNTGNEIFSGTEFCAINPPYVIGISVIGD